MVFCKSDSVEWRLPGGLGTGPRAPKDFNDRDRTQEPGCHG